MAAIVKGNVVPSGAAERMVSAIEAVAVNGYLEPTLEAVEKVDETAAVSSMSALIGRSLSEALLTMVKQA